MHLLQRKLANGTDSKGVVLEAYDKTFAALRILLIFLAALGYTSSLLPYDPGVNKQGNITETLWPFLVLFTTFPI